MTSSTFDEERESLLVPAAAYGYWVGLPTSQDTILRALLYKKVPHTVVSRLTVNTLKLKTTPCEPEVMDTEWGQVRVAELVEIPVHIKEESFVLRGYVSDTLNAKLVDAVLGEDVYEDIKSGGYEGILDPY